MTQKNSEVRCENHITVFLSIGKHFIRLKKPLGEGVCRCLYDLAVSAGSCKRISALARLEKQPAAQITLHTFKISHWDEMSIKSTYSTLQFMPLALMFQTPADPSWVCELLHLQSLCFVLLQLKYSRRPYSGFHFFFCSVAAIKAHFLFYF